MMALETRVVSPAIDTAELPQRVYALRDGVIQCVEQLLREWESTDLTLTLLTYLLCRPERRAVARELVREIEAIQQQDAAPEWERAKLRIQARLES
jgi:hypothetical protein